MVPSPKPSFRPRATPPSPPRSGPTPWGGGGGYPPRTGPKRGQTGQKRPKTTRNGPKRPGTAPRGPWSRSVTLRSLCGAHGRLFGDRGDPVRPLGRPCGSVLGRFGPDAWRHWRAWRRTRKMAVALGGGPESRSRGHFSAVPGAPPSLGGFHPLERPQRPRRTPYQAALKKGVCPKMIPATLGRCTGHM